MTRTPVYFNNASQVVAVTVAFTKADGTPATPATVACAVTAPNGSVQSYTYTPGPPGPNVIYATGTGTFELDLMAFGASAPAGLWTFAWAGAGGTVAGGSQLVTGSFRILAIAGGTGLAKWYVSIEDVKSRLGPAASGTADDYELQLAVQGATDWLTGYCGQHFFQVTEARTFAPHGIWELATDPFIAGSISSFTLDYDGDGTFEVAWTEGVHYQALREGESYNPTAFGTPRPDNYIRVLLGSPSTVAGGQFFPFVWPFTHADRVRIAATWGWAEVPAAVQQAALMLAVDLFKIKDAPWGVAGMGDLGLVKAQANPWIVELLRPYVSPRRKVGI